MSETNENTEIMPLQANGGITPPPPEKMTLQQKIVELRKAVPRIAKEKHSPNVDYKFAKIDDVWGAITPVMNELGVNFEVIKEQNASCETMMAKTKYGERLMFVYRADLTLLWTNADDPEDFSQVELFAIAWNDDPAKAKGSAWTYALKYYLYEKFSIDMGEDDPDSNNFGAEDVKTGSQQPKDQNKGNTPPKPQNTQGAEQNAPKPQENGSPRLSDKQIARLYAKADSAGMTKDAVKARVAEKYRKNDLALLTRTEYDEICAALDEAAAKKT